MSQTRQDADTPLAIVAGSGSLPFAVAEAVARRGRRVVLFPLRGWADADAVRSYTHHWVAVKVQDPAFPLYRIWFQFRRAKRDAWLGHLSQICGK